jgi:putative ABC transport system permease protein
MNWLFGMAWRNIRRNRRRTFLAATSIALAVMLTTWLQGFTQGIIGNMVKNLTRNETGHVLITTRGYAERSRFLPLDELLPDPEGVMRTVREIPGLEGQVVLTAGRITFGTLLTNGPRSVSALGIAGDPETEKSLLNLDRGIVEGRYLAGTGEVILGHKAAADLGLGVGDSLRILTQGADSGLRLRRFRIVGLFSTGLHQLDGSLFQIPLDDAKDFLRTEGGVQQILVILKDYRDADRAAGLINGALSPAGGESPLSVRPWTAIGDLPYLIKMMESVYGWMYVIICGLGAIIISNILMMVVLERRREIGILKSMGLKRGSILFLFVTEGALMGAAGSAAGALAGLGLCIINSIWGLDFSAAMSTVTMPLDPVYYAVVNPLGALSMFLIGLGVSVVVSLLPSLRAAAMDPVDAIKSVA